MPQRVNVILAVGILLLGLAGASLFRRTPSSMASSGPDAWYPESVPREMALGSRGSASARGPTPGPVPPTAIPAYYARQPDRPNPPLPRSPCVPAVLDRLYEPRGPLAAPQAAAPGMGGPRRTIAAEGFPRAHTIADGDTLPGLAARYLNDAQRWVELFEANRKVLSDPGILPLGAVLKIPPR